LATPRARRAYETLLLETWKDADGDLPIVQQAKAEYRKLKG